MSFTKKIMIVLLLALVGIQFIKVEKTNPPATKEIQASPEVISIFKSACYDCHSNETVWPWYSKIAPISFLIVDHVNEGRRHLNFSTWGDMYTSRQREYKKEIWREIENGKMPIGNYTLLHPKSKLNPEQLQILKKWAEGKKF